MSFSYQFDYLPSNILTLSGDDFFQFIKSTLGEPKANSLFKISVKTTSSFLLIENPLDILNEDIEDEELEKLKEQLCFKMKNDKLLIQPDKKQSDDNVSSISSVLPKQTTTSPSLSISKHQEYVLKLIKKWCLENKENLVSTQGIIRCKCGKVIALSKNNGKIQVLNYYKHLVSLGCSHMKQIFKKAKGLELTKQQQQQSTTSVSSAFTSHLENSLMLVLDDEQMVTQRPSNDSLVQPKNFAKRRITSQSQQHSSTKRIRT
ncbi:unnamed protein product [Rotaria sp. Silwood1]|nr:unnamed protein product [Rotaria sp. Silwood1]CAF1602328.1 unnamed protein product [Rotaria sp. Silwood1]